MLSITISMTRKSFENDSIGDLVSEEDRRRWDQRHAQAGPPPRDPAPPSVFEPVEAFFPVEGRALEIACGRGETGVWLAGRGMEVVGVDVSPVALELARGLAAVSGVADRCQFELWDLDDGLPPGPPMDLVVCHMYRDPRLDQAMVERLSARWSSRHRQPQ